MRYSEQSLISQAARTSRLDKSIIGGLLAAVAFTALSHGAVEAWSRGIFEIIILGLILLWGFKILRARKGDIYVPEAMLPLAALILLGVLQSIALFDRDGRRLSLSLDVEATRTTTLAIFFLTAAMLIAANFFDDQRRLRLMVNFLIIFGLVLALFALIQHLTWNGHLYWWRPLTRYATPFGPFVNRNHFAGYMEMLAPLPVALLLTGAVRRDSRLFYLFAAAIMTIAAVASLSRGGMISIAASLVLLAVIHVRGRGRWLPALWLIVILAFAVGAGIFWIGPERVADRVSETAAAGEEPGTRSFYTSRGWMWEDTLNMFAANPVLGVGLGAYETAYPLYSQGHEEWILGHAVRVDRAHNDYLQALSDGGIVMGIIILWFLIATGRAVFRGLRSRDRLLRAFAMGSAAGLFGMLIHSLFDFNLQLPSNALLFLLLVVVASRAGALDRERRAHYNSRTHLVEEYRHEHILTSPAKPFA